MSNTNCLILGGNLTKDASVHTFPDGGKSVEFDIASSGAPYQKGGETVKPATYMRVKYGIRAGGSDGVVKMLTKGTQITVAGEIYQEDYEAKDGGKRTKIVLRARSMYDIRTKDAKDAPPSPADQEPADVDF